MSHDVRAYAVEAARRGWAVFPIAPDSKRPRYGLKWPEAATSDPETVARCKWRPGEGYGIAAKPSGLVIIDLDRLKPGYKLPPEWRDEPGVASGEDVYVVLAGRAGVASWADTFDTFTVTTPSGGRHLYFTAPAGRPITNKPLGPLVDVRGGYGDGGYVVGPGSVINGRTYEVLDGQDPAPLPAWVAADLLDPPGRDDHRLGRHGGAGALDRGGRVAARLDGLIAAVLDARPGERNNTLHWAACRAAEMVSAGQLTEDQVHDCLGRAAARAGLDDGEAWRTIASALRHPLGRTA